MRRLVSRWEDIIKIGIEERAGSLRSEFIWHRMGRTDTVVILIFNQLTPYNAKNFLIA
jgi:hypothetical protein